MSPSLLQNALFRIEAFAAYTWIASPSWVIESPLPAIVVRPSTKSTRLLFLSGIGHGSQQRDSGVNSTLSLDGVNRTSSYSELQSARDIGKVDHQTGRSGEADVHLIPGRASSLSHVHKRGRSCTTKHAASSLWAPRMQYR